MFLSSPFPLVFSQQCLFFFMAFPIPRKNLPPVKFSSYYLMIARKFWIVGLLYAQVCFYCDLLDPSPLSILWAMGSWSGNLHVDTVELYLVLQLYSCSKFALPFFTVQLLVLVLPLFLQYLLAK